MLKKFLITVFILAILLFVLALLVLLPGEAPVEKGKNLVSEYAESKGFTKYFQYEKQWYANVNGKWVPASSLEEAKLMNYAGNKGFTKYFQYEKQWYVNVRGKWVPASSLEEAKQLFTS